MTPTNQGDILSGDLGLVISQPDVSMVVGRIEKTHWTKIVEDSRRDFWADRAANEARCAQISSR